MKKPILPDVTDAFIVALASSVLVSVFLIFAFHLFHTENPQGDRAFSTANFAQVFRSPF